MQDPKREIANVINTLCMTKSLRELGDTVTRYFVPDAKLLHPMLRANSRNEILGCFQWYRLASPETRVTILSVIYDVELSILVVELKEKLNVWFMPVPSKEGRKVVQIQLQKLYGYYFIKVTEDLTHPMDQIGFLVSPLLPLVSMFLRLGCFFSNLGAYVFGTIGLYLGLQHGTVGRAGLMEAAAGLLRGDEDKSN